MKPVKVMVLCGEGINCERETAAAFARFDAQTELVHVHEWQREPTKILNYQILALPGGFSFGDELHSGQIMALDLKYSVADSLQTFLSHKGLVLGICNGFQILMKLGIFEPQPSARRQMTLFHNRSHQFQDRWVNCGVPSSRCIWTRGMSSLSVPIRHGEGRLLIAGDSETQRAYFEQLERQQQVALVYDQDVNGSYSQVAGLTDVTGQVLGLMPHPEAALDEFLCPVGFSKNTSQARQIFANGVKFALENARL